jgi:hypothetical protein
MGEACSVCGIASGLDKEVSWGNLWERGRLKDPGVEIRVMLIWLL